MEFTINEERIMPDKSARFWNRVSKKPAPECWLWSGNMTKDGYGRVKINGKTHLAHRLSYALNVGELVDRLVIHHKCGNKACVNPNHLAQVTSKENTVQYANDMKLACQIKT